jgi:DNA polymerase III alpha subunit
VESRVGYRNLCRLITETKRGVPKGEGRLVLDALTPEKVEGLVALAGVDALGARPDLGRLARLREAFGPGQVVIDVQRHRRRAQEAANQALLDLADASGSTPSRRTACATRARPAAPCSTSSPASARSARWPTPAGSWPRTRSAT